MSVPHLAKGSSLPPFNGKLRVYSMRFCPYVQRTILVLNAKNVPYEVVNVNLEEKPEWLFSKSPLGKVPVLEVENGVTIQESLITAEYLDDKYPLPSLVNEDPLKKAQDKLLVENFNKVTTLYYKVMTTKHTSEDIESIITELQLLQEQLMKRGTPFFRGSYPGMVDYMIWPWFERFEVISKFSDAGKFELKENRFSVLLSWISAMKQDPAVKAYYLEPEIYTKFFEERLSGKTNYDFLL